MSGPVELTMAQFVWPLIGGSEGGSADIMSSYFYVFLVWKSRDLDVVAELQ